MDRVRVSIQLDVDLTCILMRCTHSFVMGHLTIKYVPPSAEYGSP